MICIPVNGKNERMGSLFKTPKHLLLVDGQPAIKRTVDLMRNYGKVKILAGENYFEELQQMFPEEVQKVIPTDNVVETVKQAEPNGHLEDLWVVDCDVVPQKIGHKNGNAVYVFKNDWKANHYSNFELSTSDMVTRCNEKGEFFPFAGAGVYYFARHHQFLEYSVDAKSISGVFSKMIEAKIPVRAAFGDITRIGTLPDIVGFTDNILQRTITKTGKTVGNEAIWYDAYTHKWDIPKIYARGEHSLTLEYIHQDAPLNIYEILDVVEKYRTFRPINALPFGVYIDRIAGHLEKNTISGWKKLLDKLYELKIAPSFAHGDLSVKNIISTQRGIKLIDPLYCENFGSYKVDYAKLLFSLKFYNNDIANYNLLKSEVNFPGLDVLIASECVRVATYKKEFNFIAENLIAEL